MFQVDANRFENDTKLMVTPTVQGTLGQVRFYGWVIDMAAGAFELPTNAAVLQWTPDIIQPLDLGLLEKANSTLAGFDPARGQAVAVATAVPPGGGGSGGSGGSGGPGGSGGSGGGSGGGAGGGAGAGGATPGGSSGGGGAFDVLALLALAAFALGTGRRRKRVTRRDYRAPSRGSPRDLSTSARRAVGREGHPNSHALSKPTALSVGRGGNKPSGTYAQSGHNIHYAKSIYRLHGRG